MIDFIAGLVAGLLLHALVKKVLVNRARRKDEYFGTKEWALAYFAQSLAYECPEGHAGVGEHCDTLVVWVCLERIKHAEEMGQPLYDVEIGVDEYLPQDIPDGVWVEVGLQNDCGYGCKIYQHTKTGRRALAHNAAYGCARSFRPNDNKE